MGGNGPNSKLKGRKAKYIQFYLGDLVTSTVDQEINTVSGRVGTLCICLGVVWGGRLAFFVMEDDVSKLIIILSPVALVILVSTESNRSHWAMLKYSL